MTFPKMVSDTYSFFWYILRHNRGVRCVTNKTVMLFCYEHLYSSAEWNSLRQFFFFGNFFKGAIVAQGSSPCWEFAL